MKHLFTVVLQKKGFQQYPSHKYQEMHLFYQKIKEIMIWVTIRDLDLKNSFSQH